MRWLAFILPVFTIAAGNTLIYPLHQADKDPQLPYVLDVLRLAIRESGVDYRLVPSKEKMVQSREIADLSAGRGNIDILWTMTSPEREQALLPIRVPIDRGLIGWRVGLVQQQRRELFDHVGTLADLAGFAAGQMHDWPDTTILRGNGLKVETTDQYESLFKMLSAGRFDYFPRSIIEVSDEWASHRRLELAIEPHLLIRYPTAFYFFVSRNRPDLAQALERGLQTAARDGQLKALFYRYVAGVLKALDVNHRTVIELKNPLLPPGTPFDHAEYWYRVGE
ncbi:MAG: transporter substrate-binding domain-containing protein [Burkholderiales bacterium]|nr:transporter substrate-binding domain-containing protein [Burkholderiales bacterium]